MKRLVKAYSAAGYTQVQTYLNTGNVIFCSQDTDAALLAQKYEQIIRQEFQLSIPVVIQS